jgi:hypothetical protein
MFVYVGIAIVILSFGFIFWRQLKVLGKKISNYIFGGKASQN